MLSSKCCHEWSISWHGTQFNGQEVVGGRLERGRPGVNFVQGINHLIKLVLSLLKVDKKGVETKC